MNNLTLIIGILYSIAVITTAPFSNAVLYVTLCTFFLLGMGFAVTGILMLTSLRKHFPAFYKKMGCPIFAATLMLTIPLEIRAINWLL